MVDYKAIRNAINNINPEDILQRRIPRPVRATGKQVIDLAKMGKNFVLGQGSPLYGQHKPNFTLGQSGPLQYTSKVVKKVANVANKNLDAIYGKGNLAKEQAIKQINDALNGVRTQVNNVNRYVKGNTTLGTGKYKVDPTKVKQAIGKEAIKEGPTGAKSFMPFVGDSMLFGTGVWNMQHGHPWVGLGQDLIATYGLTADTLATLGAIASGGTATPAAIGIEAGKKASEKALQKGLMKAAAWGARQNLGKKVLARDLGGGIGLPVAAWLFKDNNTTTPTTNGGGGNNPPTTPPTKPTIKGTGRVGGGYTGGGGNYGYVNQGDMLDGNGNIGAPDGQLDYGDGTGTGLTVGDYTDEASLANTPINPTEAQGNEQQGSNIDKLIQYYLLTHPDKKDYYNQLQNYAKDYSGLQQDAFNRDRYFAALSGLSGNNAYQKMMGSYNPAEIEATRLDLLNKALGAQGEEYEGLGELIGNAAVARQIGLPEEAAFANKNLLTAYTGLGRAQYGLQGKMYSADVNRDTQLRKTQMLVQCKQAIDQLDNQYKLEIAKGNWANAREVANIKAQVQAYAADIAAEARRDVANINVAGFGNPQGGGQINPLLLQKYGLGE